MKRSKTCPKCQSTRIGHVPELPDAVLPSQFKVEYVRRYLGYLVKRGFLRDEIRPLGQLEAYVCGDCGHIEKYARVHTRADLESIPGFRWLGQPDHQGPFR